MTHLAFTATALIALTFHAPLWAADLLITSYFNGDPLIMAAAAGSAGAGSSAVTAYALLVVLHLSGAAIFFVAVLRLHLALISQSQPAEDHLADGRKGTTVAAVTTAAAALSALAVLGLCVVVLQF